MELIPADAWRRYEAWNDAVRRCFFDGQYRDEPVYLDLEAESLAALASAAGSPGSEAESAFVEAVRATLSLPPSPGSIFEGHVQRAKAWAGLDRTSTPPFLGLLAFLSLVAEHMKRDSTFHATNYYGRLCSLLGLPGEASRTKAKVVRDYMAETPLLWRLYNEWIEDAKGLRGKPTAYAFDYRVHVGIPISQALIRERDRRFLREFFVTYRLQPGQVISRSDMARLLQDWLPSAPISAALKAFMRQRDVLDRVADIVGVELQAWDGTIPAEISEVTGQRPASIVLVGRLHRHPRPSLDLEVLVRSLTPIAAGSYQLAPDSPPHAHAALEAVGGRLDLLGPHLEGWQGFRDDDLISVADLLLAYLRLQRNGVEICREPRRLVVFEHDEQSWSFVEVPRAHFGRDLLLLTVEDLGTAVRQILEAAARPGYQEHRPDSLLGLPSGWIAYSAVQLMRMPDVSNLDLLTLIPVAWTEIALGGGFRLPGRSTWLRGRLPEVRVTAPEDAGDLQVVVMSDESNDGEGTSLGSFTGSGVMDLSHQDLVDGDYRVVIVDGLASTRVLASTILRVRSATHPRVLRGDERTPLFRRLDSNDGWSMLSSQEGMELPPSEWMMGGQLVGGARAPFSGSLPPSDLGGAIRWASDEADIAIEPAEAEAGAAPGCIRTGAHYILLPPGDEERPRWNAKIKGVCKYCGLERWYPLRLPVRKLSTRATAESQAATPPPSAEASPRSQPELPPIAEREGFGWKEMLDGLGFVRRGRWQWLEGVARQVRDAPWSAPEICQLLSSLGHLEFALDRPTVKPAGWAMAPPALATVSADGKAVLCGWRSDALVQQLVDDASRLGGVCTIESEDGIPVVVISGLASDDIELLAAAASGDDVVVAFSDQPALQLASRLLPLSTVAAELPLFTPPINQRLERWDTRTNQWAIVNDSGEPGAYRSRSMPRRHGFRSKHSAGRSLVRGNAQLVKWLVAVDERVGLLAYDSERAELITRIGAGLPGLYERAAVLCSGRPPLIRNSRLVYRTVPPSIAGAIWERLVG